MLGNVGRKMPVGSAFSQSSIIFSRGESTYETPAAAASPTVRDMAEAPPGVPYSTNVDVSTCLQGCWPGERPSGYSTHI
eukprot:scaffold170200_cov30-Tisochrysis_lutea.AAC.5